MKTWSRVLVVAALSLVPATAHAQLRGHNLLGDFGLKSASQPERGGYVGLMVPYYNTDTIVNADGTESNGPTLNMWGIAPVGWFVTDIDILGANYGFMVVPTFVSVAPELPRLGVDDSNFGFGDVYVVPVQLGWHGEWIDAIVQYGFFAPTGRYEFGALDNFGLGMWSHELAAGITYYIDDRQRWHFATTAYWEFHGDKEDTDIRVGDIVTLEGGLGHTFEDGAAMLGAAYYAQWKVSSDSVGGLPGAHQLDDHQVVGVGPELRFLYGALVLRGLFEFNAESYYQGFTINGSFLFKL